MSTSEVPEVECPDCQNVYGLGDVPTSVSSDDEPIWWCPVDDICDEEMPLLINDCLVGDGKVSVE